MAVYKRRDSSDTWHWCTNCSKYPKGPNVQTNPTKPSDYELCNECKAKEKAGTCRK